MFLDDKPYTLLCFSFMVAALVQGQDNETQLTTSSLSLTQDDQCPLWFFYNTATEKCECYHSPSTDDIVKCTEQGALLRYGNCMTYEEGEEAFVGRCRYFEISGHNTTDPPAGFITLPDNVSKLNDYMCGPMNRKGLVCSECIKNFGPSVTFIWIPLFQLYQCLLWGATLPVPRVCPSYSLLSHCSYLPNQLHLSSVDSFCALLSVCGC